MYWHGAQEDTKRTVNEIIADRAKGVLVVTGIRSSPCPLEDLKPILESITLNEMQFGTEHWAALNLESERYLKCHMMSRVHQLILI